MAKPPVLALDVDGARNAEAGADREIVHVRTRPQWATSLTNPDVVGQEVELRIDQRDGRFLAAVESLGVQIVWCTTRQDAANEVIGPLYGLGPRDVLAISEFHTGDRDPMQAKAAAIARHFDDRPGLWLDDVAWWMRAAWAGLADRRILALPANRGLRRADREQVLGWFMGVVGGESRQAREVLREAGRPDAGGHAQVRGVGPRPEAG